MPDKPPKEEYHHRSLAEELGGFVLLVLVLFLAMYLLLR